MGLDSFADSVVLWSWKTGLLCEGRYSHCMIISNALGSLIQIIKGPWIDKGPWRNISGWETSTWLISTDLSSVSILVMATFFQRRRVGKLLHWGFFKRSFKECLRGEGWYWNACVSLKVLEKQNSLSKRILENGLKKEIQTHLFTSLLI